MHVTQPINEQKLNKNSQHLLREYTYELKTNMTRLFTTSGILKQTPFQENSKLSYNICGQLTTKTCYIKHDLY